MYTSVVHTLIKAITNGDYTKEQLTVGVCVCGGVSVYTLVKTKSNCRKERNEIEHLEGKKERKRSVRRRKQLN